MNDLIQTIQQQLRISSAMTGIPASRIHIPTTAHDPVSRAARAARNQIWKNLRSAGHGIKLIAAAFRVEQSTVRHALCPTRKKYGKKPPGQADLRFRARKANA